ncbi:MAG: hypothetical protein HBSAPP02_23120 [Phycisphaerae bacterium]|nr:MAG: hypothetical protein HBSAPP02_23120 [Phycisphaerae bacterium]
MDMPDHEDHQSLTAILAALRASPDALPWHQRVEIVEGLHDRLASPTVALTAQALVELLVSDPKPEVRQAVAKLLPLLPDEVYSRLRPRLEQDDNALVRRSAERAVEKRQRAERLSAEVLFGIDHVHEQLKAIGNRYGEPATRQAWRLCERYSELLVGSMLHDLRSILTHLKSSAKSLLAEELVGTAGKSSSKRLREDIEHLERTVADMEQFAEPLEIQKGRENLLTLVRAAHDMAVSSVHANGEADAATVEVRIDIPERITVDVARHHVVAALANAIKNAYEAFASPLARTDGRRITITALEADAGVEMRIGDNGIGFSQEEAKAVLPLTPGRRNKTKRNSTGYGLPNAMRKIKAHGGTMTLESNEGCGTTVIIRLPASAGGPNA